MVGKLPDFFFFFMDTFQVIKTLGTIPENNQHGKLSTFLKFVLRAVYFVRIPTNMV